ncbi:universal stress protein [Halapricum salinum]|nr:universal stress protein [Halapricum salinum]
MALELLLAVGAEDSDRIEAFAETATTVIGDRTARVTLGHVLTEGEYERAVDTIAEHVDRSGRSGVTGRPETGSLHVSVGGESVTASEFEREQSALSPGDAAARIIGQKTLVRDLTAALEDRGIDTEIRGAIGDPADAIVEMIEEVSPDFVVIGGRDRSPAQQAVFGSVSQQILRSVDCPVISVRSNDD